MTVQGRQDIKRRVLGAMSPALWVAAACVLVVFVCAVGGGSVAPGSPDVQRLLVGDTPPSDEFWAGTDKLGRDVLARTVAGARTALIGPTVVAAGAFAIATVLGLLAGYFGGWIDSVIMRGVDIILALPGPLIAIVVVGVTGGGYWTAVGVLVVLFVAPDTRIVRSAVLVQRSQPYIEAARIQNIPRHRILFVHILPNVMPIILSYAVLDFAFALVNLAGLSFLGLGVEPGTADWGRMLFENRNILFSNPAALLLPAAMIVITAGCINMLGDMVREAVAK